MKKLFVSILALTAFAACQSDFQNDVNFDAPQGGSANVGGSHTLYAEVGVGEEDTKATYGEGLVATWEENDQIALLQEHANYGATFSVVNRLNIKDGWGTSKALFNGDISVDATEPRVYHIAYPASAVEFETTMTQEVAGVSYNEISGAMWQFSATGYGVCTYNSTLSITIPTTQYGKWEPYMYASTSEAVDANAIGAKTLTTLTGAIAIRAFEPDGVTPKQLKQITITSSNADIAGAFTGTATSVGNTQNITGDKGGKKAKLGDSYKEEAKSEALTNLANALQNYKATSTTVTKALSLSFVGGSNKITATNLDLIASEADDNYTYHLNVAPFEGQDLTIELMDAKGLTMKCNVSAKSLSAGHRVGYNIKWVMEEEASLTGEYIKTWYENPTDSFKFADNTIHIGKLEIVGNIEPENVIEMGVMVNNTLYGKETKTLSRPAFDIELSSGDYNVYAYAKVNLNGKEEILKAYEDNYTVTSIPTLTNYSVVSSYSKNGEDVKDNGIDGRTLTVTGKLSDDYFANNGLVKYSKVYNGNAELGDLTNGSWSNTNADLGQYSCYVKIELENGYICQSDAYKTHITGIPYYIDPTSSSPSGWKTNNTGSQDSRLLLKKSSAYIVSNNLFDVPESCDVNVIVKTAAYHGWGSSTNNLYINPTVSDVVKSGTAISVKGDQYYPNQAQWENKTQVCTLTTTANEISIYADIPKSTGIQGFTGSIMIEDLWVQYKLQ